MFWFVTSDFGDLNNLPFVNLNVDIVLRLNAFGAYIAPNFENALTGKYYDCFDRASVNVINSERFCRYGILDFFRCATLQPNNSLADDNYFHNVTGFKFA